MIGRATLLLLVLGLTACGARAEEPDDPRADDAGPRRDDPRTDDAGPAMAASDAGRPDLPDLPDSGPRDAGPLDAGELTTFADVQPILLAKCGECHTRGAPFDSSFGYDPLALEQPTSGYNGGCEAFDGSQMTLRECVVATARHQWQQRSPDPICNSSHPGQYHRDYAWTCLEPEEVQALEDWAASGYPL